MTKAMLPTEIEEALKDVPGWAAKDGCILKKFIFATYMDGIRFVEAVAIEAEALDHHPDILVRYADVTVFLSTHSANGLTYKDFDLASRVEKAFGGFQASKPL
jgi:4a-hydroxytetrahydrobiopterin dehydratase